MCVYNGIDNRFDLCARYPLNTFVHQREQRNRRAESKTDGDKLKNNIGGKTKQKQNNPKPQAPDTPHTALVHRP